MGLRKPPLYAVHDERGAKVTEFGGWEMPVEFDSIRTEHAAVRESAGIFDVSHMGEVRVTGPDAETLMQRLTTNDVSKLVPGKAQYSTITNESGDIIDDTVVYRLGDDYLFIPNAGHDEQTVERWESHRDEWGLDAHVKNETDDWGMFALQGPDAVGLADAAANADIADLSRFSAVETTVAGSEVIVARTGYTGEDGVELLVPVDESETVWSAFDVQPCGLGARDTLRLEAGFLLSGEDFNIDTNPRNPYEAGISFVVKLDTEFVGRDALAEINEQGVDEQLVGFRLTERGVPRHGYDIQHEGAVIGQVTSGTMSPTLGEPIGMGYVPTEYADPGTAIEIMVRGRGKSAEITSLPFLKR